MLNTVVCMFSEYCTRPFEVEPVDVVDALGNTVRYPDLAPKEFSVPADFIPKFIGADIAVERQAELLKKMQLDAAVVPGTASLHVKVPPTRSDILHAVDIAEDVAIAHGFNNIARVVPGTVTVGKELPVNHMSELLRVECAAAGYTEILTWALCSRLENFDLVRRKASALRCSLRRPVRATCRCSGGASCDVNEAEAATCAVPTAPPQEQWPPVCGPSDSHG